MKRLLHITKGENGGLDFISEKIFSELEKNFFQKIIFFNNDGASIYNKYSANKAPFFCIRDEVFFVNFIKYLLDFFHSDLIHVHHTKTWVLFSPLFLFSNKVIFTFHMSFGSGIKKSLIEKFIIRLIVSYCTIFSRQLIFLTDGQKKEISKYFLFKKYFLKKAIVIHNFIEKEYILNKEKEINFDIIYVGRYTKLKGFYDLIRLSSDMPNINFHIIGSGDRFIDINKNIIDHGVIKYEEVYKYYDKCGIFLLPSYTEAFPLVILEAMARGLVILTSNLPGIREIIKEGKNGFLFNPGDINEIKKIIIYLKKNPDKIKEISKNNLLEVLKFEKSKTIEQYIKLYNAS